MAVSSDDLGLGRGTTKRNRFVLLERRNPEGFVAEEPVRIEQWNRYQWLLGFCSPRTRISERQYEKKRKEANRAWSCPFPCEPLLVTGIELFF